MAEVIVPLPMLPMSRPGAYAFEVVWNDEVLGASGSRRRKTLHRKGVAMNAHLINFSENQSAGV